MSIFHLFLFAIGALFGSYINVVGMRYTPEDGFRKSNAGRSACPHCGSKLKWYELVPIFSFILQAGKCRSCKKRISLQYPLSEIISGLIFVFVSLKFGIGLESVLWIAAFSILLVISIIDLRLKIIPDNLNIALAALGALRVLTVSMDGSPLYRSSFIENFAITFGAGIESVLVSAIIGALFGGMFFWMLYAVTKGRGMGFGDVKFAAAIGLLLRWPDTALALMLAFIIGAAAGITLILFKKTSVKAAVPFGPFMALGVAATFFFGYDIVSAYFNLFAIY